MDASPVSPKNKHIEKYLDYYCDLSPNPKFAVLIKGKWGCGKSWFIEEYREKLKRKAKSDKTGKKSLYVSLYGMTNFSDIEYSLFQQLHPVLSSQQMIIVGKVVKGLLKGGLKIDLDTTDDKPDNGTWNLSVPELEQMKDKFNDSKFSLLIFDDLERCQIPLESLLGYINSFVNSYNLKVVIIGNEEVLLHEKVQYKKFKEKLIGQTFEVSPDLHAALKQFIKDIKTLEVKQIFDDHIEFIEKLYKKSKCNNLRTLNKIVLDFERIFLDLPNKAKKHPNIIEDIIEILIIFSIEIHQGNLEPSIIGKLIEKIEEENQVFLRMKNQPSQIFNEPEKIQENNNNLPYRKIFIKYDNIINDNYNAIVNNYKFQVLFPDLLWWEDFFDKGIVNSTILETKISNSIYFQDENTPNWQKLLHFYLYSDKEFKDALNSLDLEYKGRKYEDIYEVKTATMLFFYFSNLGLYNKSGILQEAKEYIDYLKNHNKLDWKLYDDATYEGKSFVSEVLNYSEYKEFNDYLKESQEQIRISKFIEESQNLLKIMEDNLDEFCKIINKNITNGFMNKKFYNYPILQYANAKEFVSIISKIPNNKLSELFEALQLRYLDYNQTQVHSWGRKLIEEIDFLEQVQNLLLELIDKRQGELSGYFLKSFKENYLDKVVNKIKEIENAQ